MADGPTTQPQEPFEPGTSWGASVDERLKALEERPAAPAERPVTQPPGDFTHSGIELVGRHVPEEHDEVLGAHERRKVMLPGTYEIGALIEGAFIPLARLKAAEVLEAIDRAKQAAEQPEPDAG